MLLGPGSLYTSIVANLLIPGIGTALHNSRGKIVLPLNLMTQPGETDGMDGIAHLDAIEKYAGEGVVDIVLVNLRPGSCGSTACLRAGGRAAGSRGPCSDTSAGSGGGGEGSAGGWTSRAPRSSQAQPGDSRPRL